jgi:hypothetical protein
MNGGNKTVKKALETVVIIIPLIPIRPKQQNILSRDDLAIPAL